MVKRDAHSEVDSELRSLIERPNRSWVDIGRLLDRVDKTGYWKRSAGSFSDWVRAKAPSLGLGEASMWRFMSAVRMHMKLERQMLRSGYKLASIQDIGH